MKTGGGSWLKLGINMIKKQTWGFNWWWNIMGFYVMGHRTTVTFFLGLFQGTWPLRIWKFGAAGVQRCPGRTNRSVQGIPSTYPTTTKLVGSGCTHTNHSVLAEKANHFSGAFSALGYVSSNNRPQWTRHGWCFSREDPCVPSTFHHFPCPDP